MGSFLEAKFTLKVRFKILYLLEISHMTPFIGNIYVMWVFFWFCGWGQKWLAHLELKRPTRKL